MDREKEIRFQPLTDGLGFHPFADGLPYAPTSKKPSPPSSPQPPSRDSSRDYSSGSGAVSAGTPRFAYPSAPASPTLPRAPAPPPISSSSVDAAAERIRRELESIQSQRLETARKQAHESRPMLEIRYGLGYTFQRAFAFVLDTAFNLAVCASVLSTALLSTDLANLKTLSPIAATTVGIFLFLCNWALLASQEVAFGTTLGKRIFGMKLDGDGFSCFMRSILFIPSLVFGGLGLWIAIFDSRKRCWHDRVTKLQPEQ
jgi:hypothetical protein